MVWFAGFQRTYLQCFEMTVMGRRHLPFPVNASSQHFTWTFKQSLYNITYHQGANSLNFDLVVQSSSIWLRRWCAVEFRQGAQKPCQREDIAIIRRFEPRHSDLSHIHALRCRLNQRQTKGAGRGMKNIILQNIRLVWKAYGLNLAKIWCSLNGIIVLSVSSKPRRCDGPNLRSW